MASVTSSAALAACLLEIDETRLNAAGDAGPSADVSSRDGEAADDGGEETGKTDGGGVRFCESSDARICEDFDGVDPLEKSWSFVRDDAAVALSKTALSPPNALTVTFDDGVDAGGRFSSGWIQRSANRDTSKPFVMTEDIRIDVFPPAGSFIGLVTVLFDGFERVVIGINGNHGEVRTIAFDSGASTLDLGVFPEKKYFRVRASHDFANGLVSVKVVIDGDEKTYNGEGLSRTFAQNGMTLIVGASELAPLGATTVFFDNVVAYSK